MTGSVGNDGALTCRLCDGDLSAAPVHRLENAPAGSLWFPSRDELARDRPVVLEIYQCPRCGLVQLQREPLIYYDGITSVTGCSGPMMEQRRTQARELVRRFDLAGKKILEVGCGDGHFLRLLRDAGAGRAVGLEPSRKAKHVGEQDGGVDILEGTVEPGRAIPGHPYDGFATLHVLEHVPRPVGFLAGIASALGADGAGLIEVPSFEQALQRRRFYDFQVDHLSYFTRRTLEHALGLAGLEPVEIYRDWNGEHLVAFVRMASAGRPAPLDGRQDDFDRDALAWMPGSVEALRRDLQAFVDRHDAQGKRVAVWGASHHSLAVLAITRVGGIRYVIDSAPAKQGCLTPASHVPVVSPVTLAEDPVDAVLVIAPRYDREIVELLTARRDFRGAIAVLNEDRLSLVRP